MSFKEGTFFDHIKYGSSHFNSRWSDFFGAGVLFPGSDFALSYPSTPNMTILVSGAGTAWALGFRSYFDGIADVTLTFAANTSGNPRIDIIEVGPIPLPDIPSGLNQDLSRIIVKQGTPAGSPVAPAVDTGYVSLYEVAVANGATQLTSGNVTDKRANIPFYAFSALFTTLGDTIYGGASPAGKPSRLAGNITPTRKFLRQVGNGSISAAPAWDTVTLADVGITLGGTPSAVCVTDSFGNASFSNSLPSNIGINVAATPAAAINISTNTTGTMLGFQAGIICAAVLGAGNVADVYGWDDNISVNVSAAGTKAHHVAVKNATIVNAALDNEYGLHASLTSGSGKFNVYADGTAPNYFKAACLLNALTQASGLLTVDFATANSQWGSSFNDTGAATGSIFCGFRSAGSQIGSITNDNNTGVLYNITSDYRLKENVDSFDGSLDKIMSLLPRKFNFKSNPKRQCYGFVAHELQSVFPYAVTGEKDAIDKEKNPILQQVDASKLIPVMVAAMQEMNVKIKSLQGRKTK